MMLFDTFLLSFTGCKFFSFFVLFEALAEILWIFINSQNSSKSSLCFSLNEQVPSSFTSNLCLSISSTLGSKKCRPHEKDLFHIQIAFLTCMNRFLTIRTPICRRRICYLLQVRDYYQRALGLSSIR